MKIKSVSLSIVLGITSYAALAQLRPPQSMPDTPASEPGAMSPPLSSPPTSSGSDTSGANGSAAMRGSGAPPATPAPDSSGTSGASSNMSSGASGMQSESGAELRPAAPMQARLQPQTRNDVTYLCGGVGKEEAAYMRKQEPNYDMMLTFAARNGEFLADVNVDIKDAKGNSVLQTNCDSPMMLVDLPKSGSYHVHADAAGYTQNQTVKVRGREGKNPTVASVVLSWPQRVAQAPAETGTATGSSGGGGHTGSGAR